MCDSHKSAPSISKSLVLMLIIPLFFLPLPFSLFFSLSSSCFWPQEQLDVALSKTCKHFDVSHYTKVQLAYTLLGKTQVSGLTRLQGHWEWPNITGCSVSIVDTMAFCLFLSFAAFQGCMYLDRIQLFPYSPSLLLLLEH